MLEFIKQLEKSLQNSIWKYLIIQDQVFYIKTFFDLKEKNYRILITDLIHVWFRSSDAKNIEQEKKVIMLK